MNSLEQQLEQYKRGVQEQSGREEKIRETICASRQAFCEGMQDSPMPYFEFLYQQAAFIQKRWWIFQMIILAVLWAMLNLEGSGIFMQRSIGALAPVFAIMLIPELWKNKSSGSVEIEGAAYFSIRQIYAGRLLLFAMADVLLLSAFFTVLFFTVQIELSDILVQFFLPFNVTCCICFGTLFSSRLSSEFLSVALCLLWGVVWSQIVLNNGIYTAVSGPVWIGAVVFSALYLCFCVFRGLRKCGDYREVYWS